MSSDDSNEWMSAQAAQAVLRRSDRQIRNYASQGRIKSRRRGPAGRVEYHRLDVEQLAAELRVEHDRPRVEVAEIVPAVQLQATVERLYDQLRDAEQRAERAETALRLLPPPTEARRLEVEAAEARVQVESLRAQLAQSEGTSRAWQRATLILAAVTLAALVAVVLLALLR